jgi:hypothetical protein
MKEVTPYKSESAALESLDNGGRFYNVLTQANDGEITSAELSKVAGAFSSKQDMNLYLEMSLADLENKAAILSSLSIELRDTYQRYAPHCLTVSSAMRFNDFGSTAVINGTPKYIDSKSTFSGFIMVPIMTGNVTTFSMIPIMDQYDVYELSTEDSSDTFLLAHARSENKLTETETRFGGYLRELQKDEAGSEHQIYLELKYYTPMLKT